jgi:hypothetical protein
VNTYNDAAGRAQSAGGNRFRCDTYGHGPHDVHILTVWSADDKRIIVQNAPAAIRPTEIVYRSVWNTIQGLPLGYSDQEVARTYLRRLLRQHRDQIEPDPMGEVAKIEARP